jgi:CRISPR-associated endonuclease Csn1
MWTARFRREWGLFLDAHGARDKRLQPDEAHSRKEKDRADHRQHAIDAIAIALGSDAMKQGWLEREQAAARAGINTADDAVMEDYRGRNRLPAPGNFQSLDRLQTAARASVYGGDAERPVAHRPVKRRLVGALHEETLRGPVLDANGRPTGVFTTRKKVADLKPDHLRLAVPETREAAIARLSARRLRRGATDAEAAEWARSLVESPIYRPRNVDPSLGKGGLVRDIALRLRLRDCLTEAGIDADSFRPTEMRRLAEAGGFRHLSGVPISSVTVITPEARPVLVPRRRQDYASGKSVVDPDPRSLRAYRGGNNHHIEIRMDPKKRKLTGLVVSAFEAMQRNSARLAAMRRAGIPSPAELKRLRPSEREKWKPLLAGIERQHPIVDRRNNPALGGEFVMSLAEGEMLWMRDKEQPDAPPSFFVVAKLDGESRRVVMVPHWDARAASGRRDAEGRAVDASSRYNFHVPASDLARLAPPAHPFAVKVRVSPAGKVRHIYKD